MSMNLDKFLREIDNLHLRKKDYIVLKDLYKSGDNKMLVKILEEIFNGELEFSDLERVLSYSNYEEMLREQMNLQNKLYEIISLRNSINLEIPEEDETVLIQEKENGALNNLYNEEYEIVRDNILYRLTEKSENESALVYAYKLRLYNAIKNGEYIISKNDENDPVNDMDEEYIDPDDILLFLDKYILPVAADYQSLNDFDIMYMEKNNLTEDEMKHIKFLTLLLKKDKILKEGE